LAFISWGRVSLLVIYLSVPFVSSKKKWPPAWEATLVFYITYPVLLQSDALPGVSQGLVKVKTKKKKLKRTWLHISTFIGADSSIA
jgi:hypothetical protein